jgi:peptidoglycan/LPS O-acetylase OafA/YrhL
VRRIPQLDGLRALAVGLVVLDHCVSWFPGGGIGVGIFFVLSGFLITSLLADETTRTGKIGRARFYTRRALRLYPALVAVLLITPLLIHVDLASLLIVGTYTSNLSMAFAHRGVAIYGHTWSLALEEQFYLLWPLFLPLFLRMRLRTAVGVLVGLALASAAVAQIRVGSVLQPDGSVGIGVFNPFWQAHGLIIGCSLALLLRQRSVWPAPRMMAAVGLVVCLAVAAAASATVDNHWGAVWNLVAELAAAMLILGLVASPGGVSRAFAWAPVVWVGARSYAIYLWHLPLIVIIADTHGGGTARKLAAVAATVVAAAISWRLVETPFLKLKERFSSHGAGQVPAWQQTSRPALPAPAAVAVAPAVGSPSH